MKYHRDVCLPTLIATGASGTQSIVVVDFYLTVTALFSNGDNPSYALSHVDESFALFERDWRVNAERREHCYASKGDDSHANEVGMALSFWDEEQGNECIATSHPS